jgi:argininosuccinate synthase
MKERIALAYSGSLASSAAVAWLMERHGADVVTVTVDVGQTDDLEAVRARALACGALRAHVIDARDTFARDVVIDRLRAGGDARSFARLADPLVAKTLVEIARIDGADAVAHAAVLDGPDGDGRAAARLETWLYRTDPALRIVAPAREWDMGAARLAEYARARNLPGSVTRPEAHLLIRRVVDPARAPQAEARLDIAVEQGVPVSLNGVPMTLQELIESVSLIAGQYGVGFGEEPPLPAAHVLEAAYRAASGTDCVVRVDLRPGIFVVSCGQPHSELVNR